MRFEPYPFEKLSSLLSDITPPSNLPLIDLTIGEPQFNTPRSVTQALCEHAPLLNKYPKSKGESALRESILGFLERRYGLKFNDSQLIPTLGTRELLFSLPVFLLNELSKPKMAFPNPFYQIYEGAAIVAGANIAYLDASCETPFTPEHFQKELAGCQVVIINTPHNPTTRTLGLDELKLWAQSAMEQNFVLISDECYSEIYLETPPPSILEASQAIGNTEYKNILACNSISKRSSAPGLRSGFVAGDAAILESYMQYRTYMGCAIPLPLQMAASRAWGDEEHVQEIRKSYQENLRLAQEILDIQAPESTFYLWLNVGKGETFTRDLYAQTHTKVLPGAYLGRKEIGSEYIRIALVEQPKKTKEALQRIKNFLQQGSIS